MTEPPGRKPPPASTDLDGWREAIADGSMAGFRAEALVAAIQDLGPSADANVRRAIARRLSDSILRMLRRFVGLDDAETVCSLWVVDLVEALVDDLQEGLLFNMGGDLGGVGADVHLLPRED